ncbi:MAG: hypothetical protein KDA16_09060 [Phycisphaerales bacterium]|nr:hypothetical protein [Phycisphaerales bacterium]
MTRTHSILLFVAMLAAPGCTETRIVEERGVITLRDLQPGGLRPVRADQPSQTSAGFESVLMTDELPGTPAEDDPLRRTMPDRSIQLFSFSPRHLIHHLQVTIQNNEPELINQYLISESLKDHYTAQRRDPREIPDFLIKNARDVQRLLKLLPLGENTPGATFEDIGRNRFRLAPLGADMLELRYHALQLSIEDGQFRLLMLE